MLTQRLGEELYAQSRGVLTNSTEVQVIGVYVGWRGRSLPDPFDYLTIWPRKEAAERVGDGDLREFLARLEVLYQKRNTAGIHPFLGLVAVGHSLGGQVLLRSTAPEIERELVVAAEGSQPPFISGFGDLAVLVNPAVEANQFERIHRLPGIFRSTGARHRLWLWSLQTTTHPARACSRSRGASRGSCGRHSVIANKPNSGGGPLGSTNRSVRMS